MVVYAGTGEESFQEVIDLILKEFNRLKKKPLRTGNWKQPKNN